MLTEGRSLLGDQVRKFSALQETLGDYPNHYTHEEHLQNIRAFYRIATTTGARELMVRADPHSEWIADAINTAIQEQGVIDVGCCDGIFTVFYALKHPSYQFIGIDLSGVALELAQQRAEQLGIHDTQWVCGDILDTQIGEYLNDADTIIFQDVLYQILGSRTTP